MIKRLKIPLILLSGTLIAAVYFLYPKQQEKISFAKDIKPILNNNCISCHGGVKELGGFSILSREGALSKTESGEYAIIPGDADNSQLIKLLRHPDPEERMPQEGPALSEKEIVKFEKWINDGAEWEEHWSFVPPTQPEIPDADEEGYNEVDNFVLARLESTGLSFQEDEDNTRLLRRVYMDLIGIPPTPEQLNTFLNNSSELAYEEEVDKLLSDSSYGEKWTGMWLDLSRYADSKGYVQDMHRETWKYRDWLIDAINSDLPYDNFIIQLLAGDQLPNATDDEIIATAFHRNTMDNDEGGTDNEEFRVAAVIDRVNTTMDVFMGLTFACVQCHSHPYDPIRHDEYYKFMAFLNNTADADLPNEYPTLKVYQKSDEKIAESLTKLLNDFPIGTANHQLIMDSLNSLNASALPIMKELEGEERRKTFVFERGNWLVQNKEVSPGVPKSLDRNGLGEESTRLDMARWIGNKSNPLTARVAVNRYWGMLFGKGIVETQEDFGSQGSMPTHPELLDWLAIYFSNDLNWSVKGLIKTMVMSKTYRQSAKNNEKLIEDDPYNYLLSRGPRKRLRAEQVRDQALAVSGLLSNKMYGPSVKPFQPEEVWSTVFNKKEWIMSKGEDQYRRAIYTYWKRTSPYPSLITFDVPTKEFCINRRINTNTPLQALVTLNDPVFIEAAENLAEKMETNGNSIEEKIIWGYKKALLEDPSEKTLTTLLNLYNDIQDQKQVKLVSSEPDDDFKPMEVVANTIMNLDSFLNY